MRLSLSVIIMLPQIWSQTPKAKVKEGFYILDYSNKDPTTKPDQSRQSFAQPITFQTQRLAALPWLTPGLFLHVLVGVSHIFIVHI